MKITPLDRGIEDIYWQEQSETRMLPTGPLLPGDAPLESLLDELFTSPSFVDRIAEFLTPDIVHRHILQSGTFQSYAHHILDSLKKAADAAATPQIQRTFLAALDVLEELQFNMEILSAYRKLLLKG